jgi:thiamine-monophosphate kinase
MNNKDLRDLGEVEIIKIIENLIFKRTGKKPIRDDSFFVEIQSLLNTKEFSNLKLIINSDMLISTTDVPIQMSYVQMGRKAILMNVSDLLVKGVVPKYVIVSLGLPEYLKISNFKELMNGIIDYSELHKIEYVGGDLNRTKEIVISPTVFGIQENSKIIYRNGINVGDFLITNGKFGLTGVGFDILLNKKGNLNQFPLYKKSIRNVLETPELGNEALILAENHLINSSIDSSDGLSKSLKDLMLSNPKIGFEINFDESLIDIEAVNYSKEFNVPLENLVFNGGEEFIHIYTIDPKKYDDAYKIIKRKGGQLYKVGKVISEEKIYYIKEGKRIESKSIGFNHFLYKKQKEI